MLNASLLIRVLVISRGYFSFVINHSVDWAGLGWVGIVGYQTSSCFQVMPTCGQLSRERASRYLVFEDDVQGVDDTGDVTQDGEQDVDEEVGTASALEEDTDGRQDDGEDDLDDVAVPC